MVVSSETLQDALHLAVPGGIGLQPISDDGKHDLELSVVSGVGVEEFIGLLIKFLDLDAFMDKEGSVTIVIDDEVGSSIEAPIEGMLYAIVVATWSWVEKMQQEHRRGPRKGH